MNRVLNKRIFRDLRENFLRYLALFLMIVMGMYIIVSVVGAAETVITRTEETGAINHVEDGQFSVFTQLTAQQEKAITDKGVTLEKMFSFDLEMPDNSVLRIFRGVKKSTLSTLTMAEYPKIWERYFSKSDIVRSMKYPLEIW